MAQPLWQAAAVTFAIRVNAPTWRAHQSLVLNSFSDVGAIPLPVVKSNGYGLGQTQLIGEVLRQGGGRLAVGTVFEALDTIALFNGDIVVLEPYQPADLAAELAWQLLDSHAHVGRVIRTIADREAFAQLLQAGGGRRFVLELRSSMKRFGMSAAELADCLAEIARPIEDGEIVYEGISTHLPISPAQRELAEIVAAVRDLLGVSGRPNSRLWVSHVSVAQAKALHAELPGVELVVRVGSKLWLGSRTCLEVSGTVLNVVQLAAGQSAGYRGRKRRGAGHLVTVSGGTAHGIGLVAPSQNSSLRQRAVAAATGVLDGLGLAKSPFSYAGRQLWFFEPPHQQLSMLFVPKGHPVPEIGELLNADVRYTTTHVDTVTGLD